MPGFIADSEDIVKRSSYPEIRKWNPSESDMWGSRQKQNWPMEWESVKDFHMAPVKSAVRNVRE